MIFSAPAAYILTAPLFVKIGCTQHTSTDFAPYCFRMFIAFTIVPPVAMISSMIIACLPFTESTFTVFSPAPSHLTSTILVSTLS